MRKNIYEELLNTEESYYNSLKAVYENFIQALLSDAEDFEDNAILPRDHLSIIFGNWEVPL